MALTLPVVFFLFQIVAIVPFAALILHGAMMALGSPLFGILVLVHFVVYGLLLWVISYAATRIIVRIGSPVVQKIAYGSVLASLVLVACITPYGAGGHGKPTTYTWFQAFVPWW